MPLRVNLLRRVEVRAVDTATPLGRRERVCRDAAGAACGAVIPVTRIIDELWLDVLSDTATNITQGIVCRLRRSLGPDLVTTAGSGFSLNRSRAETDLDEVARLATKGRIRPGRQPN